jgi:hypothetical protein
MNYRKLAKPGSRARRLCRKCGVDTIKIGEYYMLRNEVWQSAIERGQVPLDEHGQARMLCIGCIESLLGRQLTYDDFTSVMPRNWPRQRQLDLGTKGPATVRRGHKKTLRIK